MRGQIHSNIIVYNLAAATPDAEGRNAETTSASAQVTGRISELSAAEIRQADTYGEGIRAAAWLPPTTIIEGGDALTVADVSTNLDGAWIVAAVQDQGPRVGRRAMLRRRRT